ncbi:MAG: hypothetical protein ACP5O0_05425 [Acidimicrobiales bacterium]
MSPGRNPGVRVAENDLLGGDDEGVFRGKMSPTLLGSKLDVRALYDPGDGYVLGFADGTTMSFGGVPALSSLPSGLHSGDQEKVIGRSPAVAMTRSATGVLLATAEGAILRVDVERSRLIDQGGGDGSCGAVVAVAASDSDGWNGWVLRSDGSVHNFGAAQWHGDLVGELDDDAAVAICRIPVDDGYAIATARGRVFRFGVDGGEIVLRRPNLNGSIVALVWGETRESFWLAASDGGVFSFGQAGFYGSRSGAVGAQGVGSVVGMVKLASGQGYWVADSHGSVRAFGRAAFLGSALRDRLEAPCIGIA